MRTFWLILGVMVTGSWAFGQPIQVETGDGLALHMQSDGRAIMVSVDRRLLAAPDRGGGFVMADMEAEIPPSANLIRNPSAELDADGNGVPDGWTLEAGWSWDDAVAHSGKRSLKVTVPSGPAVRSSGALTLARFEVEPGRRYVYNFWVKTQDSGGRYPSATYLRQYDADGKPCAPQQGLSAKLGTNDWFLVRGEFQPKPETRFADLYANIYQSHGTCWYDDFSLIPADAAERPFPLSMADHGDFIEGKGVSQDVELRACFRREPNRIRADVELQDLAKRDRRLVVAYNIPLAADGWTWWDNVCMRRVIDKPSLYEWCQATELGEGKLSIYPFSSITNDWCAITLGVPLDQGPRIWTVAYDNVAKLLKIRFCLGLSRDTAKFPGKAAASFLLYRHDPKWGMRSAAKRFYEFYPEHFVKRFPFEAYLNYANLESTDDNANLNCRGGNVVEDAADFGEEIPHFAHMHGGYACDFWPTDRTDAPSDDEVRDFLARHAKEMGEPENSYTPPSQILKQITLDPEGRIRFHRKDCLKAGAQYARPDTGGWFFEFRVMEDPEVSDWVARYLDRLFLKWREKNPDLKPFHYCMSSDEIQGYTGTGSAADYRREHFQYEDIPLSFNKNALALARINLMYDFLKTFLWPHSQKHQYLTTGNANNFNRSFCFPFVDMGMVEWEWDRSDPLRTGAYARTMSCRKLYRFWRVCGKGEADPASVVTHLHRCLYWAMYPAVGGLQAATHNLNDYRYLYRRYVSIVERLSASGWDPIPHATVSPEGALIERYGRFEDGSLHFAITNISGGQMITPDNPSPKTVAVSVDCAALAIPADDKTLLCEDLTETRYVPIRCEGGKLLLDLSIPNAETRVVRVSNRPGRAALAQVEEKRAGERILRFYRAASLDQIKTSPRYKNGIQAAKLEYRRLESAYPARSDEKGIRIHVPNWPVVFKNRDASVAVAVENIGDKPISVPALVVTSPFDADVVTIGAAAPGEIGPGQRKEAAVPLRVSDRVPRNVVPLCVTALGDVTRVVDVRVMTLAPTCELLPERLSTTTDPQQLLLILKNPFQETIRGQVEIIPPGRITAEGATHAVEIAPGQTKRVTCHITVPEKQRDVKEMFRVAFAPAGEKAVEALFALRAIGNRKRCTLPWLDAAPQVNGKLDDAAWQKATVLDDFRDPRNPVPAKAATRVKAGRFGDSLYFAVDCDEPTTAGEGQGAAAPAAGGDRIEFRFLPGHRGDLLTFSVTGAGARSSRVTNDWEAAASYRPGGYGIVARIPLQPFGEVLPDGGEVWGFNVLRYRTAGGETTQWSQSNWSWDDPVFYGDLIFPGK